MIEQLKDYLEVSAVEYRSFVKELKPEFFHKEEEEFEDKEVYYIISNTTDKLICGNLYNKENEEVTYYIVNMPDPDERAASQAVRRIILENEKEVRAFFNIINKAKKGE